jgi:hypothetical protein
MENMIQTPKSQEIIRNYYNCTTISDKRLLVQDMVVEFTKRLRRYTAPEGEMTLARAAFRFFSHKYDDNDGLDGQWLKHDAFGLQNLLRDESIPLTEKYALFTALFQSGKTFIAIDLVIMYLSLGFTPILVVPKSSDAMQLQSRMKEAVATFVAYMKTRGFSHEHLAIYDEILYHSSTQGLDDLTKITRAITQERTRAIVCLKEHTHLHRINQAILNLQETNQVKIALFIDEAHIAGGYKRIADIETPELHDVQVKYDIEITTLKDSATKVILQTATAANIFISEPELWSDCIYRKNPGPWYRGPTTIQYQTIGTKDVDQEISTALIHLSNQEPRQRRVSKAGYGSDRHPIYLLMHATRSIAHMKGILKAFYRPNSGLSETVQNAQWLAMTFTGEGLRIWHHTFSEQPLVINGITSIPQGNGEHLLENMEPCFMMDWCGQNGGVERFPRIVVLAYDMGEEGITFGSHKAPYWHLTHLLLFGNTTSARTAQILNRLSGNHGDDHPLVAMVSQANKEKSIKEFLSHEQWVRELYKLQGIQNVKTSEFLKGFSHLDGRLPKRYISLKESSGILSIVPNENKSKESRLLRTKPHAAEICHGIHGGELYKEDYKQMLREKVENESQEETKGDIMEENEVTILPKIEFERLTTKMFPKWAKEDTKIARFMKNLDPVKIYSATEMKEYVTQIGKDNILHLMHTRVGITNGDGQIIQKINDTYMLYPQLVTAYKKYFN